jgi:hypothetical protein
MEKYKQFTAIIEREGNGYVPLCPELDIASQGDTVEKARATEPISIGQNIFCCARLPKVHPVLSTRFRCKPLG